MMSPSVDEYWNRPVSVTMPVSRQRPTVSSIGHAQRPDEVEAQLGGGSCIGVDHLDVAQSLIGIGVVIHHDEHACLGCEIGQLADT